MKNKLNTIFTAAIIGISLHVTAQETDKDTPTLTSESVTKGSNMLTPGSYKLSADLIPKDESVYKVTMIKEGAKTDGGIIKERYVIDLKKGLVTLIGVAEKDKEKRTDTTIVKLETFEPVYRSSFDNAGKLFLNYDKGTVKGISQPVKGEAAKINFNDDFTLYASSVVANLIALLPDDKMEPVSIPVFDEKQSKTALYNIMNVKNELNYAGFSGADGIYVVDLMAGSIHSRIIIDKTTNEILMIEKELEGGVRVELKKQK